MKIPVWWVPIAFFASSFGSIILSCSTAFARGDAHGIPHVSQCSMHQPERTIFGLGMTLAAVSCAFMVYVIYLRNLSLAPPTTALARVHHDGTLFLGIMGNLGICGMAWVTVNDFPIPHLVCAIGSFFCFFFYATSNLVTRVSLTLASTTGGFHERLQSLTAEAFMAFCVISSVISTLLWVALDTHCMARECPQGNPVGSSLAQYCIIASIWFYFLPYTWELRRSSLVIDGDGAGGSSSMHVSVIDSDGADDDGIERGKRAF